MRKKLFLLAALSLTAITSFADTQPMSLNNPENQASPDIVQFFNDHILEFVKLNPVALPSLKTNKVFLGNFYKVTYTINDNMSSSFLARVYQSKLSKLDETVTNMDLPNLMQAINPEFKLTDNAAAEMMQDALDVIYPINTGFGNKDLESKTFWQAGNKWLFVRGKFMDRDYKGFIFSTAPDGKIISADYSLNIQKTPTPNATPAQPAQITQ